jgi:hypothetical protein
MPVSRKLITEERYGLSDHAMQELAKYNSEVARGLVHTDEWRERMSILQDRYHEASRRDRRKEHSMVTVTSLLGPAYRDRKWRDREGWIFEWSGNTFWHIYRPDGTLADDLIEEVLNDYTHGGYGPWTEIGPSSVFGEAEGKDG